MPDSNGDRDHRPSAAAPHRRRSDAGRACTDGVHSGIRATGHRRGRPERRAAARLVERPGASLRRVGRATRDVAVTASRPSRSRAAPPPSSPHGGAPPRPCDAPASHRRGGSDERPSSGGVRARGGRLGHPHRRRADAGGAYCGDPDPRATRADDGRSERTVPAGRRRDREPRFAYRGAMLDVARHFFAVEEWSATSTMALLQVQPPAPAPHRRPGLAHRDQRLAGAHGGGGRDQVGGGGGGYYTQDDYAEIVDYAAERFIAVVRRSTSRSHERGARAYPELNPAASPPSRRGHRGGVLDARDGGIRAPTNSSRTWSRSSPRSRPGRTSTSAVTNRGRRRTRTTSTFVARTSDVGRHRQDDHRWHEMGRPPNSRRDDRPVLGLRRAARRHGEHARRCRPGWQSHPVAGRRGLPRHEVTTKSRARSGCSGPTDRPRCGRRTSGSRARSSRG